MKALRCTSHRERAKERDRVCGGGTREIERVAPWTSGVFLLFRKINEKEERERGREGVGWDEGERKVAEKFMRQNARFNVSVCVCVPVCV